MSNQPGFIRSQPDEFWARVGIYAAAIHRRGTLSELSVAARSAIIGLGIGNLRLLCDRARLATSGEARDADLADSLLTVADVATLTHLREFSKGRAEWIDLIFAKRLRRSEQQRTEAHLRDVARVPSETLKPLTKLLVLYQANPNFLLDIFYLGLWQSRSSSYEYKAEAAFPKSLERNLVKTSTDLAKRFGQCTKLGVRFAGSHVLPDKTLVLLFLREYPPRVVRDFYAEYDLLHQCGLIVLGLDSTCGQVHLKTGNKRFAKVLQDQLATLVGAPVGIVRDDICSDYNVEFLREALVGRLDDGAGVDIVEASYKRSAMPGGAPLSIKAPASGASLRQSFEILLESAILDSPDPLDIDHIVVSFEGRTTRIESELARGGAALFRFDNAGWPADQQQRFENGFQRAFGVPLNRLLDPSRLRLGSIGIFSHILRASSEADIEPYQQECLEYLVENSYVQRRPSVVRGCRNNLCDIRYAPVTIASQERCLNCEHELEEWRVVHLMRNQDGIASLLRDTFQEARGWSLSQSLRKFEGHEYYALERNTDANEDDTICVLMSDHVTKSTRRIFERFSYPLLIAHAHVEMSGVYVDSDGIGRLSVPYLLAAESDASERTGAIESCGKAIDTLLRTYDERVQKAARHSAAALKDRSRSIRGHEYEVEIFNLLRAVFPYCHMLGREGKAEPDGFVCVPDYREAATLADTGSWNWTYDAKHSDKGKGYDLTRDECRKMREYIEKFRNNRKVLDGKYRRMRAHVIISNQLTDEKMQKVSRYLFGSDGLNDACRDVRLILMRDSFLQTLVEWVQSHSTEFRTRRGYFGEVFIKLLEDAPVHQYRSVAAEDAGKLIADFQKYQVIEKVIPAKALEESLDEAG